MSALRRLAVVGAAGLLVAGAGVMLGAWWLAFPVGLAIGAAMPRARIAIPLGAVIGLLAWGLPLASSQWAYGLGSTASSLAAIMGFGHQGAIPVALTCVVGLLLGLTGAWLGAAIRALVQPAISRKTASVSAEGATPSSR